jgi:DUF2075 family protein
MIVYESTKREFIQDVRNRIIDDKIYDIFKQQIGRTSMNERRSWRNSLKEMREVLDADTIPEEARVAIEYQVPNTAKRVDFLISGLNEDKQENVVIVELKQWEKVEKTTKDAIVVTYVGGGNREITHPSYQAWSYASLIEDFNQTVQNDSIQLKPCAFLHNYRPVIPDPLTDSFYNYHIDKAPLFLEKDIQKLSDFISKYVKYPDDGDILYRIENGKIKPSKSLAESVGSMIQGNDEFVMIDEQKEVYEELKQIAESVVADKEAHPERKEVMIIKGGPGTGKSVIAINLLARLISEKRINAAYVTKNSAPRGVYAALLKGTLRKTHINNLFKGSGSFVKAKTNEYDVLITDEAHRLNEKSGLFSNLGENQMKEIMKASRFSIFFIDEAQTVTMKDRGNIEELRYLARRLGAEPYEMELKSQFRCNGSNAYLAWLDDLLGIRDTVNKALDIDFDFRVYDSPNDLKQEIFKKNKINNKARLLAGYCWNWQKDKRNDTHHYDITIREFNFGMSWNLGSDGNEWLIKETSVNEIGCIHTSQGLELDYIGVIIGDDLKYENGQVITDVSKRAKTDQSVRGWKKGMRENPEYTKKKVDSIIRNTYRTLLTRGMKGCYIYCTDKPLGEYIKSRM